MAQRLICSTKTGAPEARCVHHLGVPDPHIILCNGEKPALPMHFSLDII